MAKTYKGFGLELTVGGWHDYARAHGYYLNRYTLLTRLENWSVEDAITKPLQRRTKEERDEDIQDEIDAYKSTPIEKHKVGSKTVFVRTSSHGGHYETVPIYREDLER